MVLYFKVGTMPGQHYRVLRLRKPPQVGTVFEIRATEPWSKKVRVLLREVREVGDGVLLYCVDRW